MVSASSWARTSQRVQAQLLSGLQARISSIVGRRAMSRRLIVSCGSSRLLVVVANKIDAELSTACTGTGIESGIVATIVANAGVFCAHTVKSPSTRAMPEGDVLTKRKGAATCEPNNAGVRSKANEAIERRRPKFTS